MKTAMQELIDAYYTIKHFTDFDTWIANNEKRLLEKEKEQIIEAFKRAYLIGDWDISEYDTYIAAEKYFNKTYQNK